MGKKITALIDLNVILDVLQKRKPFFVASARTLALAEQHLFRGVWSAHSITTLFYLYAKDQSSDAARVAITDLMQFLEVAPVNNQVIETALALPYRDFEDAVQMAAALHISADYLITRNIADFKSGPIPALMPAEFLTLLQSPNIPGESADA